MTYIDRVTSWMSVARLQKLISCTTTIQNKIRNMLISYGVLVVKRTHFLDCVQHK